jgi:hypothetical protein
MRIVFSGQQPATSYKASHLFMRGNCPMSRFSKTPAGVVLQPCLDRVNIYAEYNKPIWYGQ